MARDDRPLSPHLGIYRWQISNTLSIFHRATGVMLSIGAIALVAWLVAAASGPEAYLAVQQWLGGPLGLLMLFGWTFCFFYHLANGVRHLFWDAGMGFEIPRARMTGVIVVAFALVATAGFWLAIIAGGGGQ